MKGKPLDLIRMGQNIRNLRQKRHLSQQELAKRVGCSVQHISRLENGTSGMSVEIFLNLCRELACMPSDILSRAE